MTVVASLALATVVVPVATVSSPAAAASTPFAWVGPTNVATSPSARFGAATVYDPATSSVVLYGGDNGSFLGDTWTWNGTTWTQLTPAASPSARFRASMTYDSTHGDTVLFGGDNASGALGDTWTWNGTTWTQLTPAASPSARFSASMTFDPSTNNVVLFGGDASNALSDTWTWNGGDWTHATPATSPSARGGASMAYDTTANHVVLFGGSNFSGGYDGDTWMWNGTTWATSPAANSPSARAYASMQYMPTAGNLVLFGGRTGSGYFAQTWLYATTPNAPTNVSATLAATTQALVSWRASSFDGGSAITRYQATANDLTQFSRGGQVCATSGATSCVVAGLTKGDVYNFHVVATNAVGPSSASTPSLSLSLASTPGAPRYVTATSGANGQSLVRWTAPLVLGASVITRYQATSTDLTMFSRGGQVCVTSGTTSCVLTGLTNGDVYVVRVTASNASGTSPASTPSAPFVPTGPSTPPRVAAVPSAPRNVRATSNSNAQSRVTWAPPASSGTSPLISYTATGWPGAERCVVPARLTGCVIKGLRNGRTYVFTVTATNGVGTGPVSSPPAFALPRSRPGPSRSPHAVVRGGLVTLYWQVPLNNGGARIRGYDLYVGATPRYANMIRLNARLITRGADVWRPGRPGRYYVIVRALNALGAGSLSRVITVVVR